MKTFRSLSLPALVFLIVSLACGSGPVVVTETGSSPAPLSTATSTATLPPEPAGPCVNVFYPFVPGYQWIYKTDDGDDTTDDVTKIGLTVSGVDGSQAQIDALDISTGVITHTTVECDEGAIKNYPLLTLGTLFGDIMTGELNITYMDGVFMPAEDDFAAANWFMDWSGDYKASGTLTFKDEGEVTTATLNESPVKLEWSLVGQEPITVEGGTFEDAYKVTRKATLDVSIEVEGLSVQATLIINTNQWYAAGVGLLKNEIDSANLGYMGFTFPVEASGRVELVEFRPGP